VGRSRGITAAVMGFLVRCSLEVKAESNNCCITGLLPRVVKLLDPSATRRSGPKSAQGT